MGEQSNSWIESSDVLSLFPTCIWNLQLKTKAYEAINTDIRKVLNDMRRDLPPLKSGEAWQSDKELYKLDRLNNLISCVDDSTKQIFRYLKIGYEAFEFTGCWANISTVDASHRIHCHPNNFLSGVYYVKTQLGANSINFHDPRAQTSIIRPPVTALTGKNTDQVVVEVKNGSLLIFPSYLQHSVDPNNSCEERISISFNIMFSGFTENLSKPLW